MTVTAAELNGNARVEGRQPISWARCPVHGEIVGFDPKGRLVGRCSSCAGEAARGLREIETGGESWPSQN